MSEIVLPHPPGEALRVSRYETEIPLLITAAELSAREGTRRKDIHDRLEITSGEKTTPSTATATPNPPSR